MDILKDLNPMQREAVRHTDGAVLILAGAGSGKTRVITHRIAQLISLGVQPFNILAITFTNKAAREMRERTNNICESGADVLVCTFHSLCVRLLRRDINKIGMDGSFTIYDADDSERLAKRCIKEMNLNEKMYPAKSALYQISEWKNELITPDAAAKKNIMDYRLAQISEIYRVYQKKLRDSNALDFDDIIFKTIDLFDSRPDVLEKYQNRFRYIMVDEYQDTNTAQYELCKKLAAKYKNICVVGDDDQSIYGWRGANIRNILDFEKDYNDTLIIKLEQNYRSTQTILDAANNVIAKNIGRRDKALWTENAAGERIKFNRTPSDFEEAAYIADTILSGVATGNNYSDYAVLYRNNAQSRMLEDQFVRRSIPYRLLGGLRFYERREVKDILAYLKLIHNPLDEISFLRIVNVPRRGIGDASIEKIAAFAAERDIPMFSALSYLNEIDSIGARAKAIMHFADMIIELIDFSKACTITELFELILEKTNYIGELELENSDEARGRIDNVNELKSKAVQFEKSSEDTSLSAFLEDIALVADVDGYEESENAVVMMTLHSSKGLEFKNVFITGFEDGIFPSYRAVTYGDVTALEEERRLCYVGITRARENLYLTSAESRMQNGQMNYNLVSRFFKEIPPSCVIDIKKQKQPRSERTPKQFSKTPLSFDLPFVENEEPPKSSSNPETSSNVISFNSFKWKERPAPVKLPTPKRAAPEYNVGDYVTQAKYGVGLVTNIKPSGADYEITVEFDSVGTKKFIAGLAKLHKM